MPRPPHTGVPGLLGSTPSAVRDPLPNLPRWAQYALVLGVALAVYWLYLGWSPLAFSESHRVLPAWDMPGRGDWLVPHLFGQPYLRKPPGMQWAIAGMSLLLGRNEWGARAVSALAATLSCVLVCFFARRWWGHRAGAPAGLMQALTPLFWYPGRSAEIESLHNALALASLLVLPDLLLSQAPRRAWGRGLLFGILMLATLGVKGPAALVCVAAAIAAAMIVRRSVRLLACVPVWLGVLVAAAGAGAYLVLLSSRLGELGNQPVLQSPERFLWRGDEIPRTLFLLPLALGTSMPASLGLIVALLPPARPGTGAGFPRGREHALAIGLTVVIALGAYTILGVSNARYAMPALVLLPILTGYAAAWWPGAQPDRGWRALGTLLLQDRTWIAPACLLIGAGVYIAWFEPRRVRISGRGEGERFAATLPPGETRVWADKLIEARPEFFYYAQREASREGKRLDVRWVPQDRFSPRLPEPGSLIAIRTDSWTLRDDFEPENETFARFGLGARLRPVFTGRVHKFTFTIERVEPENTVAPTEAPNNP